MIAKPWTSIGALNNFSKPTYRNMTAARICNIHRTMLKALGVCGTGKPSWRSREALKRRTALDSRLFMRGVHDRVRNHQALHRMAANYMPFNDSDHIFWTHAPIPNRLRIDHRRRPQFAL